MKKAISADKSAPKAVRSVAEDTCEDQKKQTQVDRIVSIVNGPIMSAPMERDWNFAVENEAHGMSEIEGQLGVLHAEVRVLEQVLRPHMPDHLYEPSDEGEGVAHEGYYPSAERTRTPAVSALCELANTVQRLRRYVNYITSNVVV